MFPYKNRAKCFLGNLAQDILPWTFFLERRDGRFCFVIKKYLYQCLINELILPEKALQSVSTISCTYLFSTALCSNEDGSIQQLARIIPAFPLPFLLTFATFLSLQRLREGFPNSLFNVIPFSSVMHYITLLLSKLFLLSYLILFAYLLFIYWNIIGSR